MYESTREDTTDERSSLLRSKETCAYSFIKFRGRLYVQDSIRISKKAVRTTCVASCTYRNLKNLEAILALTTHPLHGNVSLEDGHGTDRSV